jgi:hypothetical protein
MNTNPLFLEKETPQPRHRTSSSRRRDTHLALDATTSPSAETTSMVDSVERKTTSSKPSHSTRTNIRLSSSLSGACGKGSTVASGKSTIRCTMHRSMRSGLPTHLQYYKFSIIKINIKCILYRFDIMGVNTFCYTLGQTL